MGVLEGKITVVTGAASGIGRSTAEAFAKEAGMPYEDFCKFVYRAGNLHLDDPSVFWKEFEIEQKVMQESGWGQFLSNCVSKWIEIETKSKITKFQILKSWVVRQFQNEYNPTHWHSGHISGAGFLKVPSDLGKNKQNKEKINYKGGNLQLMHGSRMFLSHSTMNIVPKVGDFYFFPNYLMHGVSPFTNSNDERRSISFNAEVDHNIYDVYKD